MSDDEQGTSFDNKTFILADLWVNYRDDVDFKDFIDYNDIGLPLAFFIAEGLVNPTPKAEMFISETFLLLMNVMEIKKDTGFETLDDMLMA